MGVSTRSKTRTDCNFGKEAASHKVGSYDQFKANEHLTNGKSTYDELLYTTEIPQDLSSEKIQQAEGIAISITNAPAGPTPDTGHVDGMTEADIHSNVLQEENVGARFGGKNCAQEENEGFRFEYIGSDSSLLSQSKLSNKAVKEKRERVLRKTNPNDSQQNENDIVFPDLTPNDFDFSISTRPGRRKKKKSPKTTQYSQVSSVPTSDSSDGDVTDSPPKDQTPVPPEGKRKRHDQTLKKAYTQPNTPRNVVATPRKALSQSDTFRKCPIEGCTWKTGPHGGQWQSYYNHVAHRHGDEAPDSWWTGEGRFRCRKCEKHYDLSKEDAHIKNCKFRASSTHTQRNPTPSDDTSVSSADVPLEKNEISDAQADQITTDETYIMNSDTPLPSLFSICALPIITCKDIPNSCRPEWEKALCGCLDSAIRENTIEAWTLLAMLPKCVIPAPHRGGSREKTSYASHVRKCLSRWSKKDFLALWDEAVKSVTGKKRSVEKAQSLEEEEKKSALRAERLVRDGELSRAMTALTSAPLAPDNDETYAKLQAKHPPPTLRIRYTQPISGRGTS